MAEDAECIVRRAFARASISGLDNAYVVSLLCAVDVSWGSESAALVWRRTRSASCDVYTLHMLR